jgi:FeS assembly protein IscX
LRRAAFALGRQSAGHHHPALFLQDRQVAAHIRLRHVQDLAQFAYRGNPLNLNNIQDLLAGSFHLSYYTVTGHFRKYSLAFISVDQKIKGGIIGAVVLIWEDSYAIALALRTLYPDVDLEEVSLNMIYRWTLDLPDFGDDRELANEAILTAIYQEWLEEITHL